LVTSLTTSTAAVILGSKSQLEPIEIVVVEELVEETLQEKADRIAQEYGISFVKLSNLVTYESRWDPKADNGYDRGLVQINRAAHPNITDEQAFDPEWALVWAAKKIANNEEHIWVVCNCYAFTKIKLRPNFVLPRMSEIIPNVTEPVAGGVVIFNYSGQKHIEYIKSVTNYGSVTTIKTISANYEPCRVMERTIDISKEKNLVGFYQPSYAQ
jgi:hypothetical protein